MYFLSGYFRISQRDMQNWCKSLELEKQKDRFARRWSTPKPFEKKRKALLMSWKKDIRKGVRFRHLSLCCRLPGLGGLIGNHITKLRCDCQLILFSSPVMMLPLPQRIYKVSIYAAAPLPPIFQFIKDHQPPIAKRYRKTLVSEDVDVFDDAAGSQSKIRQWVYPYQ